MTKTKILFLFMAFLLIFQMSVAFPQEKTNNKDIVFNTTIKEVGGDDTKKHYLIAIGGAILTQGTLFLWNKYMIGAGWTKVSKDDWDKFWQKEQTWDADWYWTNFVLHPYQGSMSYMSGRAANLNKIESFLLSMGASYAWEYFCETNAPSKNDLVYTPIGAVAVGEMLYRLSLEADEINKLFGYAINPTRLYTDLALGHKPRGTVGNIHSLWARLMMGTMQTKSYFDWQGGTQTKTVAFPVFAIPEVCVVYGNPYGHQTYDPYSQFELTAGGGFGYNADEKELSYDIHIFSSGILFSFAPQFKGQKDTTIGVGFDYDFIWHSFMELSGLSPCFLIKQRSIKSKLTYEWQFHIGYNVLGTSDNFYYFYDYVDTSGVTREYSYNNGPMAVFKWRATTKTQQMLDFGLRYFGLYDFFDQKQKYAHTGWEDIFLATLDLEQPITKNVAMGLSNEVYAKHAHYHDGHKVWQYAYCGSLYAKIKAK